jgi:aminoglycoside 3-N-acetyltransferase
VKSGYWPGGDLVSSVLARIEVSSPPISFARKVRRLLRPVRRRFEPRLKKVARALDRRTISEDRLRRRLAGLGVVQGSTVLLHSSMDAISRRVPTLDSVRLIALIQDMLGEEVTLLMPTLPFDGRQVDYARANKVFDVRRTPSRMGLLSEVFRRTPGVLRSLHPTHSVAAWGRRAEELISEHHKGTAFGESSPYFKLQEAGGVVMGLGVIKYTVIHVADELEPRVHEYLLSKESFPMRVRAGDEEFTYELRPLVTPPGIRRDMAAFEKTLAREGIVRRRREGGLLFVAGEAGAIIRRSRELMRDDFHRHFRSD